MKNSFDLEKIDISVEITKNDDLLKNDENISKNEDFLKNEEILKNEDYLRNEEILKKDEILKNEDFIKNEEILKKADGFSKKTNEIFKTKQNPVPNEQEKLLRIDEILRNAENIRKIHKIEKFSDENPINIVKPPNLLAGLTQSTQSLEDICTNSSDGIENSQKLSERKVIYVRRQKKNITLILEPVKKEKDPKRKLKKDSLKILKEKKVILKNFEQTLKLISRISHLLKDVIEDEYTKGYFFNLLYIMKNEYISCRIQNISLSIGY